MRNTIKFIRQLLAYQMQSKSAIVLDMKHADRETEVNIRKWILHIAFILCISCKQRI